MLSRGRRRPGSVLLLALPVVLMTWACAGPTTSTTATTSPTPTPTPAPANPAFILSGDWERINSSFITLDGMMVHISDDGTQALITSTPSNPFQFQIGDLKWRSIMRTSDTSFSFEDLVRQSGSGAMSYVAGVIQANSTGTELSLNFPSTGTLQQWRKK